MNLLRVLLKAAAARVQSSEAPDLGVLAGDRATVPDRHMHLVGDGPLGDEGMRDLLPRGLKELYDALDRGAERDVLEIFSELTASQQSNAVEAALKGLAPHQLQEVHELLRAQLARPWIPNPGPQTWALRTSAEVIGFGGAAGGGKTDLMCGLAGMHHTRSLILRREGTQLTSLIDRFNQIYATLGNFVSQPVRRFNFKEPADRTVIFGHCKEPGDWMAYQGQPRDLLALDEATQFLEDQVHMLMAWVRTVKRDQRTRILLATNPPTGADGYWFNDMFEPWIGDHWKGDRPAVGEAMWSIRVGKSLRWMSEVTFDDRGSPVPVIVDGEKYTPRSYTFIPSRLDDNPYLVNTGYRTTLQNMPEPMRSLMLYGAFKQLTQDDPWQVIPSAWLEAAIERWEAGGGRPPEGAAMDCIGVDIAQGGKADTVLAPRHGSWFAPLAVHPGVVTTDGAAVAGLIFAVMRDGAAVSIDLGGGWGGAAFEHLRDNMNVDVFGVRPGDPTDMKTLDGTGFLNVRTAMWWKFREALDPTYGANLALPPDREMKQDLLTPRFKWVSGQIRMETKKEIFDRLGRSTDRGDGVVMSWLNGHKEDDAGRRKRGRKRQSQANVGHAHAKGRRR